MFERACLAAAPPGFASDEQKKRPTLPWALLVGSLARALGAWQGLRCAGRHEWAKHLLATLPFPSHAAQQQAPSAPSIPARFPFLLR